ncbi:MAG: hypothetical protein NTY38_31610 [Acidobacteria bacterium]|nr:hypothetical protein [Acidobacteriota bacterium]
MKHPGEAELALYGGGELGGWRKWRMARHIAGCGSCSEGVAGYRSDRDQLAGAIRRLPEGLDWDGVEAEMRANIRVGLAAGECVAHPGRAKDRLSWQAALGLASMTALIVSGWWLHTPEPPYGPSAPRAASYQQDVVLETTRFGIERKQNGSTLALSHPSDERTVLTANTDGAIRARYVDADSGQVTIHNVYAQ